MTCDEAFDRIAEKPTFDAKRAEFERFFCTSTKKVRYVYKICSRNKRFATKLKLSGQRPTRSVLTDDNGRFDEIDRKYPARLPIFNGGNPCLGEFEFDISGMCDDTPSTFIDVKGNLVGKNQGENNFIERKYTGCWERDTYEFQGFKSNVKERRENRKT